ncbi:MAG: hypothetical protein ACSHXK_08685 [Oceanococcus sp.]
MNKTTKCLLALLLASTTTSTVFALDPSTRDRRDLIINTDHSERPAAAPSNETEPRQGSDDDDEDLPEDLVLIPPGGQDTNPED